MVMIAQRLLIHLRRHVVGYIALFIALGGTSYAALGLRDHSIDPVKLDPHRFGGYVRAWATVASDGRVVTSSPRGVSARMHEQPVPPGDYDVFWHVRPTSPCTALVNVDASAASGTGPSPGSAVPQTLRRSGRAAETTVLTYDGAGQPKALPFDVALLCSIPRR